MQRKSNQSDEIGYAHDQGEAPEPNGSERARDEKREGGPRYGGEAWKVADERGHDRFGKARNDDSDPLQLITRDEEAKEDDVEGTASAPAEHQTLAQAKEEDEITFADLQRATGDADIPHVESGGDMAGMGRGEKPRKLKSRAKK